MTNKDEALKMAIERMEKILWLYGFILLVIIWRLYA